MTEASPIRSALDLAKIAASINEPQGPVPRLLRYHDAHPITFVMVLMKEFGVEWFEWDAEVLHKEILRTYGANNISEHNWQKIQAVRAMMTSFGFWREWEVFEKVIHALNNNVPRFDVAQPCSMAQLMAGVDMANYVRSETYSDEIARYIAACAIEEGVTYLPPPLDFAQTVLSQPRYKCADCGRIDIDDNEDGRCDFCSGRYSDEHPLNGKANPAVPRDRGTNLTRYLLRDPVSAKTRFEQIKEKVEKDGSPGNLSDESADDVQAAKLMVAYQYMKSRQDQMESQLKELKEWVVR